MTIRKWQEKILKALWKYTDWIKIDSIMIDVYGQNKQGFYRAIDDLIVSGRILNIGNEIKLKV